jgi:molybdenum cofactor synthesis domain-containing protein
MVTRPLPSTAVILVIGDEILTGEVGEENAGFLAAGLTGLGIRVEGIRVVPDRVESIVAALEEARRGDALVLVSGGIGPTHDDVTRQAVAEALGVPCSRHPEAEERLRQAFGSSITEAELTMADLPEGARLLTGLRSRVYGFGFENLCVLPGVPHLLRDIFARLAEEWGGSGPMRAELVTTLREGRIAEDLRDVQNRWPEVAVGSYPFRSDEGYRLRIVLRSSCEESLAAARSRVETLLAERAPE